MVRRGLTAGGIPLSTPLDAAADAVVALPLEAVEVVIIIDDDDELLDDDIIDDELDDSLPPEVMLN